MNDLQEIVRNIKSSIALIGSLDAQNNLLGTGSGFIFWEKNILVTCNHVIKDANSTLLKFPDGEFINSKVVLKDEEHDLALLKFDDLKREPLPLGDLDKVAEGIPILFSGYPFSSHNLTTHQGIISAIIKDVTGVTSYLLDGTVNSGNSGCPLLNMEGKVIGVVNAKQRQGQELLSKVERMTTGALSLHGIDIVSIYQTLASNIQLGVGYAVPAKYIPEHKDIK